MSPLHLYARVRISLCINAHETAGAARTRSSLRPLFEEAQTILENLGQKPVARMRRCVAHPSRRAQERAPQDDGSFDRATINPVMVRRRQRVRAERGPMTGSAPSRTMAEQRGVVPANALGHAHIFERAFDAPENASLFNVHARSRGLALPTVRVL